MPSICFRSSAPALRGALSASSRAVDVGHLGDDYFINMASGGFGAEVTTSADDATVAARESDADAGGGTEESTAEHGSVAERDAETETEREDRTDLTAK